MLNGQELAGVGIIFDVAVGLYEQLVSGDKTAAPAVHIEGFAGGVQFNPDFFLARGSQETERLAFEHERGVSRVVNDDEVMPASESDDGLEEFRSGAGASRIIRIIEDKDFCLGKNC